MMNCMGEILGEFSRKENPMGGEHEGSISWGNTVGICLGEYSEGDWRILRRGNDH